MGGGRRRNGTIVLVEDDPNQAFLLKRAFGKINSGARIVHFEEGRAAMAWIEEAVGRNDLPSLVILDLQLPTVSGLQILEWLRARVSAGRLPVILLSSSLGRHAFESAYWMGANACYAKPLGFDGLRRLASTLQQTWLERTRTEATSRRILVVDDDAETRDILEAHLLCAGHEVLKAEDGVSAIKLLRSDMDVALVLLDLRMPGLDGWSCLRILRNDPELNHIPVVLLSCCAEEFSERPAEADAFLPKPIDPQRLMHTIEEMMSAAAVS